ncbi:MAG: aspartate aminotransferase family protein [Campylobacter sp.]|nr:aspartate aminotransferase family protein [Campylobacter sp.]
MLMNNYKRADVCFVKGKGALLIDEKGRDYVDFGSGIGVCSLGHANKKIARVIKDQSRTLLHTSNSFRINSQLKLSKLIDELLGYQTYAFFCNSGAEANECAIKLARKYGTQNFADKKYEILSLSNSFHGRTIATLALTGQDKFHPRDFAPYPDGFRFFDSIDEIIENISDKTVAVMIELVQGEGGIKPLDMAKVKELATVLKKRDLLLITDEVQCGVYRTGEFVTSQIYGITPDIITFAKGIGAGLPMGACVSRNDIFTPGDHGSTFGGNPFVSTVAIATLKELKSLKESEKLDNKIEIFIKKLDAIIAKFPEIFDKRVGIGLMQGLVLKESKNLDKIFDKALENGVVVLKSGKDTVRFLPPLNITKKEMKIGFERLRKALDEI